MERKMNDTTTDGKTGTVKITRNFNLPLEEVWKAWSEPASFKKWWGPEEYDCTSCKIDFKPGGKIFANMVSEKGEEIWSICKITEINLMKEIFYNDYFADHDGNIVSPEYYNMPGDWSNVKVHVAFEEANGETKMTVEQSGIPVELIKECTAGWNSSLDKLDR